MRQVEMEEGWGPEGSGVAWGRVGRVRTQASGPRMQQPLTVMKCLHVGLSMGLFPQKPTHFGLMQCAIAYERANPVNGSAPAVKAHGSLND